MQFAGMRVRSTSGITDEAWLAATRQALRIRQYSPRTEASYLGWLIRFVRYRRRFGAAATDAELVRDSFRAWCPGVA